MTARDFMVATEKKGQSEERATEIVRRVYDDVVERVGSGDLWPFATYCSSGRPGGERKKRVIIVRFPAQLRAALATQTPQTTCHVPPRPVRPSETPLCSLFFFLSLSENALPCTPPAALTIGRIDLARRWLRYAWCMAGPSTVHIQLRRMVCHFALFVRRNIRKFASGTVCEASANTASPPLKIELLIYFAVVRAPIQAGTPLENT